MQHHGEHDEADAHPEGEAHFLQLAEEHGGDGDAVQRLEVVSHVNRKSCQFAERLQLEEKRDNGEC